MLTPYTYIQVVTWVWLCPSTYLVLTPYTYIQLLQLEYTYKGLDGICARVSMGAKDQWFYVYFTFALLPLPYECYS